MRICLRSFWIAFGVTAVAATALALVPTLIDLDWNRDGELCRWVSERSWYTFVSQSGDCVVRPWALLARFLFWFAIWGGPLLGPFGAYIVLSLLKASVLALIERRRRYRL